MHGRKAYLFWMLILALGVLAQSALWRSFAPAAKCYLWEGACVYQVSGASSPYFVRDLTFGAAGAVVGLVIGVFAGGWLRRQGLLWQVVAAAVGAAASFGALKLAEASSELVVIDKTYGYDQLRLGAMGLVLAWPLATQIAVTVHGLVRRPGSAFEK